MGTQTKRIRRQHHEAHKASRAKLLKEDPTCTWCGTPLDEQSATLDHIIPLASTGEEGETPENWCLACTLCQKKRGAKGSPGNPFFPNRKVLERMTQYLRNRKISETLENYTQILPEWEGIGAGAIKIFLAHGLHRQVPESLVTSRVAELWNPITNPPWPFCRPFTPKEVERARANREFEQESRTPSPEESTQYHIRRVAHFCESLKKTPIHIDLSALRLANLSFRWPVTDGNHRLAAHIVKRRSFIQATVEGPQELLEEFLPALRIFNPSPNNPTKP